MGTAHETSHSCSHCGSTDGLSLDTDCRECGPTVLCGGCREKHRLERVAEEARAIAKVKRAFGKLEFVRER